MSKALQAMKKAATDEVEVTLEKREPYRRAETPEETAARVATLAADAPAEERAPREVIDFRVVLTERLYFRVRRTRTEELAEAGASLYLAATAPSSATTAEPTLAEMRQTVRFNEALVAAAVIAVRAEDGDWEPAKVTLQDDPTAPNAIAVRDLPPGAVPLLAARILALSNGGVAAERIASFLAEPVGP